MKTEILSQEKNVVEAKAQFTAEEVNKAIENTYKDISKKANIKGFRKGKVPRRMLELYFPKDAACAETLEKLLGDAIDNMVEEFELKLIADPDLKPEPLKENEPYEFTVTFEVTPEVTLPELGEIEAEKTIYDPCPAGYRVPDGGENGVWAKAFGTTSDFKEVYDGTNKGFNFGSSGESEYKLTEDPDCWYPFAGEYYRGGIHTL